MTATILENITSVRASLDELEAAFRAAATAVARYHELAVGLAARLGALDVQGLEELDAGHDVTPRAGVGVED